MGPDPEEIRRYLRSGGRPSGPRRPSPDEVRSYLSRDRTPAYAYSPMIDRGPPITGREVAGFAKGFALDAPQALKQEAVDPIVFGLPSLFARLGAGASRLMGTETQAERYDRIARGISGAREATRLDYYEPETTPEAAGSIFARLGAAALPYGAGARIAGGAPRAATALGQAARNIAQGAKYAVPLDVAQSTLPETSMLGGAEALAEAGLIPETVPEKVPVVGGQRYADLAQSQLARTVTDVGIGLGIDTAMELGLGIARRAPQAMRGLPPAEPPRALPRGPLVTPPPSDAPDPAAFARSEAQRLRRARQERATRGMTGEPQQLGLNLPDPPPVPRNDAPLPPVRTIGPERQLPPTVRELAREQELLEELREGVGPVPGLARQESRIRRMGEARYPRDRTQAQKERLKASQERGPDPYVDDEGRAIMRSRLWEAWGKIQRQKGKASVWHKEIKRAAAPAFEKRPVLEGLEAIINGGDPVIRREEVGALMRRSPKFTETRYGGAADLYDVDRNTLLLERDNLQQDVIRQKRALESSHKRYKEQRKELYTALDQGDPGVRPSLMDIEYWIGRVGSGLTSDNDPEVRRSLADFGDRHPTGVEGLEQDLNDLAREHADNVQRQAELNLLQRKVHAVDQRLRASGRRKPKWENYSTKGDNRDEYGEIVIQQDANAGERLYQRTGHWDEWNPALHIRHQTRRVPNPETGETERVLEIAELQSDWQGDWRGAGEQTADELAPKAKEAADRAWQLRKAHQEAGTELKHAKRYVGSSYLGLAPLQARKRAAVRELAERFGGQRLDDLDPELVREFQSNPQNFYSDDYSGPENRWIRGEKEFDPEQDEYWSVAINQWLQRPQTLPDKVLDNWTDYIRLKRIPELEKRVEELKLEYGRASQANYDMEYLRANAPGHAPPLQTFSEWAGLGLRRALQLAVDEGHDRIALPTGAQVADAMGVHNQVSKLRAVAEETQPGMRPRWIIEFSPLDSPGRIEKLRVAHGKELKDYIGKDLAEEAEARWRRYEESTAERSGADDLIEADNQTWIEGDDLRVGGEAHRNLYDRMLPRLFTKYLKKLDPAVEGPEVMDVVTAAGRHVEEGGNLTWPMTPKIREAVKSGQYLGILFGGTGGGGLREGLEMAAGGAAGAYLDQEDPRRGMGYGIAAGAVPGLARALRGIGPRGTSTRLGAGTGGADDAAKAARKVERAKKKTDKVASMPRKHGKAIEALSAPTPPKSGAPRIGKSGKLETPRSRNRDEKLDKAIKFIRSDQLPMSPEDVLRALDESVPEVRHELVRKLFDAAGLRPEHSRATMDKLVDLLREEVEGGGGRLGSGLGGASRSFARLGGEAAAAATLGGTAGAIGDEEDRVRGWGKGAMTGVALQLMRVLSMPMVRRGAGALRTLGSGAGGIGPGEGRLLDEVVEGTASKSLLDEVVESSERPLLDQVADRGVGEGAYRDDPLSAQPIIRDPDSVRGPEDWRNRDVAKYLQKRALERWGRPLDWVSSDGDRDLLATELAREVMEAQEKHADQAEWYRRTIESLMTLARRMYPQIEDSPELSDQFRLALAITSNGSTVKKNFQDAMRAFEHLLDEGRFPTDVEDWGSSRGGNINESFDTYNELIERHGAEAVHRMLNTKFAVRELRDAGLQVSNAVVDEVVYGSAIFGPKVGGGFYQNLDGNWDTVTADRWFMRTVGRLAGTLLPDDAQMAKYVETWRDALREQGRRPWTDIDRLRAEAEAIVTENRRRYKAWKKAGKPGGKFQKKPLDNAAQAFVERFEPIDEPGSAGRWAALRDIMQRAQDQLAEQGIHHNHASMQAMVWYTEQDLYRALTGRANQRPDDYLSVGKEFARERGIEVDDIDAGGGGRDAVLAQDGGRGARDPADGGPGPPGRTRGLEGGERDAFLEAEGEKLLHTLGLHMVPRSALGAGAGAYLGGRASEGESDQDRAIAMGLGAGIGAGLALLNGRQVGAMMKAGLLTNPATHGRNIISTAGMAGLETVKDVPASVIDGLVTSGMRALGAEGVQRTKGHTVGLQSKVLRNFARKVRGEVTAAAKGEPTMTGSADAQVKWDHQRDADKIVDELGRLSKPFQSYIDTVFRSLGAQDQVFKTYHVFRSLAEQARIVGRNQGLSGQELDAFIDRTLARPPDDLMTVAIADAELATFTNQGVAAQWFQDLKGAADDRFRAPLEFALPFTGTPSNVGTRIAEYAGGGAVFGARDLADALRAYRAGETASGRALQRQGAERLARALTGTGLIGLGYWMAQEGIEFSGPWERGKQATYNLTGEQPNSIKIGDRWYRGDQISPVYNLLELGALLAEEGIETLGQGVNRFIGATVTSVEENSPFETVAQWGRISDQIGRDPAGAVERYVYNRAGQLVPAAVRSSAAYDGVQRESQGDPAASVKRAIPGLRQAMPERYDAIGRPVPDRGPASRMLDPFGSQASRLGDPVARMLAERGIRIPNRRRGDDESPEEFAERMKAEGQEVRRMLANMPDEAPDDLILRAVEQARSRVKSRRDMQSRRPR